MRLGPLFAPSQPLNQLLHKSESLRVPQPCLRPTHSELVLLPVSQPPVSNERHRVRPRSLLHAPCRCLLQSLVQLSARPLRGVRCKLRDIQNVARLQHEARQRHDRCWNHWLLFTQPQAAPTVLTKQMRKPGALPRRCGRVHNANSGSNIWIWKQTQNGVVVSSRKRPSLSEALIQTQNHDKHGKKMATCSREHRRCEAHVPKNKLDGCRPRG